MFGRAKLKLLCFFTCALSVTSSHWKTLPGRIIMCKHKCLWKTDKPWAKRPRRVGARHEWHVLGEVRNERTYTIRGARRFWGQCFLVAEASDPLYTLSQLLSIFRAKYFEVCFVRRWKSCTAHWINDGGFHCQEKSGLALKYGPANFALLGLLGNIGSLTFRSSQSPH